MLSCGFFEQMSWLEKRSRFQTMIRAWREWVCFCSSEGSGCRVAAAAPGELALPVPVENLVYQPPAAMPRAHVVALADEGARPRQVDDQHYIQRPVERPSLATKRLRAAEIEAKERAKQLQFASLEIDVHGLLQCHVPFKALPKLEQPSSVRIEDLSVEQETLVQLHLEKLKAVHDFEVAQRRRIQLQQVVSAAQL